jgi:chromosome segregation ATPase
MNADGCFDRETPSTVVVNERKSSLPVVLAVGLVALTGFSFYQYSQVKGLRQELNTTVERQSADMQSQLASQNAALKGTVSELQAKLDDAQQLTSQSIARAQSLAAKHADTALTRMQQDWQKSSADQQQALNTQLEGIKTETATRFDGVGASVETVKTDLASTRAQADKTATDLDRMTGDMGVISGLIATNGKQIAQLRALGDRNIYEFNITKKAGMQKVGDIQMKLTKADRKKNRFTVVVMADDKFIEKKDKTTNEPVQFYAVSGSRQPYELVVNEVNKDTIKGYLATPKVTTARN